VPTAFDILDQHVTLQYRSLDRLYLNLYVPYLMASGGIAQFLGRLGPIASPALFERRSRAFVTALRTYAEASDLPWIRFVKGERKEDRGRTCAPRRSRGLRVWSRSVSPRSAPRPGPGSRSARARTSPSSGAPAS